MPRLTSSTTPWEVKRWEPSRAVLSHTRDLSGVTVQAAPSRKTCSVSSSTVASICSVSTAPTGMSSAVFSTTSARVNVDRSSVTASMISAIVGSSGRSCVRSAGSGSGQMSAIISRTLWPARHCRQSPSSSLRVVSRSLVWRVFFCPIRAICVLASRPLTARHWSISRARVENASMSVRLSSPRISAHPLTVSSHSTPSDAARRSRSMAW